MLSASTPTNENKRFAFSFVSPIKLKIPCLLCSISNWGRGSSCKLIVMLAVSLKVVLSVAVTNKLKRGFVSKSKSSESLTIISPLELILKALLPSLSISRLPSVIV